MLNNPMIQMFQMINQLRNNPNPRVALDSMFANNPMYKQAISMIQGKNPQEISQTIQNACKTKGIDFNQIKSTAQNFGVYL